MLAWIDRWGEISVRQAGRIVYRNRGQNPDRVGVDWKETAGLRVLVSLRRRGLVLERRRDGHWQRVDA